MTSGMRRGAGGVQLCERAPESSRNAHAMPSEITQAIKVGAIPKRVQSVWA